MRFHLAACASLLMLATQGTAIWVTWIDYDSVTCSGNIATVELELLQDSCQSEAGTESESRSTMTTCAATEYTYTSYPSTNCSGAPTTERETVGACSEGEIYQGAMEGAYRISGCSTGLMSDDASVSVEHVFSYYSDASCTQLKAISATPSGGCDSGEKYRTVGNQLQVDVYTGSTNTACGSLDCTSADLATIGQCIAVPADLDSYNGGDHRDGPEERTLAPLLLDGLAALAFGNICGLCAGGRNLGAPAARPPSPPNCMLAMMESLST